MEVYTVLNESRVLLPPLARHWRVLALQAASLWNMYDSAIVMGNSSIAITDFLDGRQEVTFAFRKILGGMSLYVEPQFVDPRFAGMMFAVTALFPNDHHFDVITSQITSCENACSILRKLYINLDSNVVHGVFVDGLENQGWEFCRDIAAMWLRVWNSARYIQQAWRAMRLRRRAPLWVPRLVEMLREAERRPATPVLHDAALGMLLGV